MYIRSERHRIRGTFVRFALVALAFGRALPANAQSAVASTRDSATGRWIAGVTILGDNDDKRRTALLRDSAATLSMFRSPSSLTAALPGDSIRLRAAFVLPQIYFIHNSDLPYSINDGALWASRGTNTDIILGGRAEWKNVRLFVLPELVTEANKEYDTTIAGNFRGRPPGRDQWSYPFQVGAQSIDLPIRFGDKQVQKLFPGQSALVVTTPSIEFGAGTENEWWGPGIRNALLLSNNAPGFPHLFIRTARPWMTFAGAVEARWMTGGLTESHFFDFDDHTLRSIALLGATLRPKWVDGLTVGAARSVFAPAKNWWTALHGFTNVLDDVGQPDAIPLDQTTNPGPDQLISLFMHWVLPADGLEVYAEWGRAEFPKSLRDFLVEPNHTQGYTVGLQWLGDKLALTGGRLRVQGEATFIEQSSTFSHRPLGSWYTSASVPQGYTQQGQTLGAAIGPGASSQWTALDFLKPSWSIGGYVTRIRWNEDARSQAFTNLPPILGWCEHDVSLLGGVRAQSATRFGELTADYSSGWRYNVFFVHPGVCPQGNGNDVRNHSLSVRFAPGFARW